MSASPCRDRVLYCVGMLEIMDCSTQCWRFYDILEAREERTRRCRTRTGKSGDAPRRSGRRACHGVSRRRTEDRRWRILLCVTIIAVRLRRGILYSSLDLWENAVASALSVPGRARCRAGDGGGQSQREEGTKRNPMGVCRKRSCSRYRHAVVLLLFFNSRCLFPSLQRLDPSLLSAYDQSSPFIVYSCLGLTSLLST
jgi:hypothetical protein